MGLRSLGTLAADSEETKVYRIRHPGETKLLSPNVTELGGRIGRETTERVRVTLIEEE